MFMGNVIGKLTFFAAGIVVGVFLMRPGSAQQSPTPGLRLNHVGIYAKDFDESMRFYTKTMGFREAFSLKDKDGNPAITYLQISRDTFLELSPASAQRPAGLSHVGIWPDDLNATVFELRQRGVKVDDPRVTSSKSSITSVVDPNGVRLELLNILPDSLQRKAIDSWR
jgi:catechol 2,3-dioxygenase-like lactoylglutathione lyase family enzyme